MDFPSPLFYGLFVAFRRAFIYSQSMPSTCPRSPSCVDFLPSAPSKPGLWRFLSLCLSALLSSLLMRLPFQRVLSCPLKLLPVLHSSRLVRNMFSSLGRVHLSVNRTFFARDARSICYAFWPDFVNTHHSSHGHQSHG